MNRILFATDLTDKMNRAEDHTLELARALGAEVTVLHAVEPIAGAADNVLDDFIASLVEESRDKLRAVTTRFTEAGVEASAEVVVQPRWRAIVETAERGEYHLTVIGTHLLSADEQMTIGSTSHKVFFAARTPLVVVPG